MTRILIFALFLFAAALPAFGQEDDWISAEALRGDLNMVAVVAHVNITGRQLVDSMGSGDCETNKGSGYCLYRLTGDVVEVFKGSIRSRRISFYISPDAGYPKERLMGERVVFLNRDRNTTTRKMEYVTLENSTRPASQPVIDTLRTISKRSRSKAKN